MHVIKQTTLYLTTFLREVSGSAVLQLNFRQIVGCFVKVSYFYSLCPGKSSDTVLIRASVVPPTFSSEL
jgi:hypothetical protein